MFPKSARICTFCIESIIEGLKGSNHYDLSLLNSTGLISYSHKPHTTTTHAEHAPSHTRIKSKQENHPLNPENTQPLWLIIISKTQQPGHYNNPIPIYILQIGLSNSSDVFHEFDKKKLSPL
jgi:hypothetical protein